MAPSASIGAPPTSSPSVDRVTRLVDQMLTPDRPASLLGMGGAALDNVAWHDFSECSYLLEPKTSSSPPAYLRDLQVFSPGSINIGIRLVYRQEWRCLGNQRGEIVKTIPLGPRQVERVSTRLVRRTRVTRTSESARTVETNTETADTTKDSNEVITEAAARQSWRTDFNASASVGIGPIGGSVGISSGLSGELDAKSRQTNARLSEIMQKTASRMRTETKVVVSTESENTFESQSSSEISNPNEELALTYVYSKLQRQYEVFTGLAEVQNVVFVALPMPESIDFDWVRRHDWILAKVLLDESFREALSLVGVEPPQARDDDYDALLQQRTDTAVFDKLAGSKLTSLSLAGSEIAQESDRYREAVKAQRERQHADRVREHKLQRLYSHIEDNIYYYMRAIWTHEDPEQRLLRFRQQHDRVQVARNWGFVGRCGQLVSDDDELGLPIGAVLQHIIDRELAPPSSEVDPVVAAGELEEVERDVMAKRDAELDVVLGPLRASHDDAITRERGRLEDDKQRALDDLAERIRGEVLAGASGEYARQQAVVRDGLAALAQICVERMAEFNRCRPPVVAAFTRRVIDDDAAAMRELLVDLFAVTTDHAQSLDPRLGTLVEYVSPQFTADWRAQLGIQATALEQAIEAANVLRTEVAKLLHLATEGPSGGTADIEAEIRRLFAERSPEVTELRDEVITRRIAELEAERDASLVSARAEIEARYAAELARKQAWVRYKLEFERRRAFTMDGRFVEAEGSEIDLADLVDPAGPIGFHGNYAIYYLKPETAVSDILDILAILKTPYLRYTSEDQEPELVDPYLKSLEHKYRGVVPEQRLRFDMVEYVPELRLRYRLAELQDDARSSLASGPSAVELLLADDVLFQRHYPEYLFRKDLTRRFPVDTNNLLVDIELGRGTALEPFKNAHRGIDVLRAQEERVRLRLENERMQALLMQDKLDARYWPEPQRVMMMPSETASAIGSPAATTTGTPAVIVQPGAGDATTVTPVQTTLSAFAFGGAAAEREPASTLASRDDSQEVRSRPDSGHEGRGRDR